jgi:hypothetical protein
MSKHDCWETLSDLFSGQGINRPYLPILFEDIVIFICQTLQAFATTARNIVFTQSLRSYCLMRFVEATPNVVISTTSSYRTYEDVYLAGQKLLLCEMIWHR